MENSKTKSIHAASAGFRSESHNQELLTKAPIKSSLLLRSMQDCVNIIQGNKKTHRQKMALSINL